MNKTEFTLFDYNLKSPVTVGATRKGKEWMAPCPMHDDHNPSLAINEEKRTYYCHGCGWKGKLYDNNKERKYGEIIATYDYVDENSQLLFQSVRCEPKSFYLRRPDDNGGWIWNLQGVRLVPYRLPDIIKAEIVFIPEGEKDADNLRKLGLTATTNPMGAGKWREEYNQYFKDKEIVILPDNDESGKSHALQVANSLEVTARSVKTVNLPSLAEGGDVSDWLGGGGTKEGLIKIVEETLLWQPTPASQLHDIYKESETMKLKVRTLDDIFSYPDPQYLVEPILMENTIIIVGASPKVGKSLLSLSIAHSLSTGKELWGEFKVNKTGTVLIVDEENPESFLKDNVTKMGFTKDLPVNYLHFQGVKLDNNRVLSELKRIIEEIKPVLVIFDSLIRMHGKKENESSEMNIIVGTLRSIANMGTTILCVHHHKKGQGDKNEKLRGSSDILAGVDSQLCLEKKDDYLILSNPNSRTKPFDPMKLKLEATDDLMSVTYHSRELTEKEVILGESIIILKDKGELGVKELKDELNERDFVIGINSLRGILNNAEGKELKVGTGPSGKKLYDVNSSFTALHPLYKPLNRETDDREFEEFHGSTKDIELNRESDEVSEEEDEFDLKGGII